VTLPPHVPKHFKDSLINFAKSLKQNFAAPIAANPEDQLKGPIQVLLRSIVNDVQPRTEAQVQNLGGRPDVGIAVANLLCGYVELKAPGKGARVSRFTGADKKQWEKFKALPNILYTDASEWALYRSGEAQGNPVRFSGNVTQDGEKAFNDDEIAKLHTLLIDLLSWQPIPPDSSEALARTLAPLCRLLREDVLVAVRNKESALALLANEWRQYLFPDAEDAQFADAYAQTLTYALLLARLNGEDQLTTASAAASLDTGHGLLAQALRVLTQPQARNEINVPVELLERTIRAVDPAKLRQRGDPWLYFYEDFLSIYDPKLRNSYGVYYTPMQVIGAQVRLVSELLETRFNKPLSYADNDVVFLDPGVGTAAYPLAAIEHALEIVEERFGAGMVAAKATECASRFYGFEILVGPYAVAHLRLSKLIADKGGSLPSDGIRIILTDTLESPHANPPQPPLFAKVLTDEHRRAQRVKSHTRVVVCLGNPPYDREQDEPGAAPNRDRKGGWVRYGDRGVDDRPILRDFTEPATAVGAGIHLKNLYNLYVYFWRWALWKLFENPDANGPGIISFITASSYLRGPGFVGMRQKMRESFDELWIIDLEGDQHGARKTENVFAIKTPVAIAIGVRYGVARPEIAATVRYTKVVGSREEKLSKLRLIQKFGDLTWQECGQGWMQPFLPRGEGAYYDWPLLKDLFPWQHSGVQFKRTWPIGETSELLNTRWTALLRATGDERAALFKESSGRNIRSEYGPVTASGRRLPAILSLPSNEPPITPVRYAYRSFDLQWAIPDPRLADRLRPPLWQVQGDRQIHLITLLTCELGLGPAAVASSVPPDMNCFNNRACHTIPLWRDADGSSPNLPFGLLAQLAVTHGEDHTPEDFFCYVYAMLATPSYVESFSEELTVPGPRVPITRDPRLFGRGVDLGRRLVRLHTYGERGVPGDNLPCQVPQGRALCRQGVPTVASGYPETFSYNSTDEVLRVGEGVFSPVSNAVWCFSVSGLTILESWLNYRMRDGAGRSSSPLDEIRPEQWTGEMTEELLKLIWLLEGTIEMEPDLNLLFNQVIEGETLRHDEFPHPTVDERRSPGDEDNDTRQHELQINTE
jgi:hypothetical protein